MRPPYSGRSVVDLPWIVSDDKRKICLRSEFSMRTVSMIKPPNPKVNKTGSLVSFQNKNSSDNHQYSSLEPQNSDNMERSLKT